MSHTKITPESGKLPGQMNAFHCNICGSRNQYDPLHDSSTRTPGPLCINCKSSVRFRLIAYLFSSEIMGGNGFLPSTKDSLLQGIGLSDSPPIAKRLSQFKGYTNTFFHKEPYLDIASVKQTRLNLDYIISSDVFEHTPPPVDRPFRVSAKMLRDGGKLLFSVPITDQYVEHFPSLHDYQILESKTGYILANATQEGKLEIANDLRFHGGPGSTLEMRIHSAKSIDTCLRNAGFSAWRYYNLEKPMHGIFQIAGLSHTWIATK